MKNVSFDNPYLLLLAIPLLLLVIVPFIIAIRKENRSKTTVASLVIHLVIVCLVTLAAAGTMITTILTETTVYVVADVSYSADRNLEEIDEYIDKLREDLPKKTELGVVCFGETAEILYRPGDEPRSVKESNVINSSTNIVNAIRFTKELFPDNSIKKMVLISDGKDTDTSARGRLVAEVESLTQNNIRLDAIFLDNNLKDNEKEIQISDIELGNTVLSGTDSVAKALLQVNYDGAVKLTLSVKEPDSDTYKELPFTMKDVSYGYNMIELPLKTEKVGVYDYKLEVYSKDDIWKQNNTLTFAQEVKDELRVLLLTGEKTDSEEINKLYEGKATIDSFVVNKTFKGSIPYSVEELSRYDEFIISNIDIRNVTNITAFLNSVEILVSQYGKTLTTMGNLNIQNKVDETLGSLGEMLPINYGNANADKKLYTLVLDTSHSMNQASKLPTMKEAAKSLLSLLDDEDIVCIITFSGDVETRQPPIAIGEKRNEINEMIDGLKPSQGTFLGTGLKRAYEIASVYDAKEKQVMLISDGKTNDYDINGELIATKMKAQNIVASTINMLNTSDEKASSLLEKIAKKTGGNYYPVARLDKLNELIFADIADEITESIVEAETRVNIAQIKDKLLVGTDESDDDIIYIDNIFGFVQTGKKLDATVVLTVDYVKEEDVVVEVPLYSYRDYGNGRVATFTSSLSNGWLDGWSDEFKDIFFGNMLNQNAPSEKRQYPFTLEIDYDGMYTTVLVTPASLRPDSEVLVKITSPSKEVLTLIETENEHVEFASMLFDTQKYYYELKAQEDGRYDVEIIYNYNKTKDGYANSSEAKFFFNISYSPEYNAYEVFSPASLTAFVSGEVVEGDGLVIENDTNELDTYEYRFTIPFLIIAMILFVADIAIRVLKFKKKSKVKGGRI
ncbi:MAG: VWA domain-containing protein [Ruminococcaceae bacterium]|nr:VWA domain-containing protein [Oscillospiraceae bacterium]